ncbi:MAG: FAD-dependent oxidoreductase [Lutispora sp.]|nr:FAD-dependent oxidoreductase [Lutispora sp.]
MQKRLLIIGAGIAGLSAAKSAREAGKNWDIIILELENTNTYIRTRIPHYISGEANLKEMMPYNDEWYVKNNLNLIKGIEVISIDTNSKEVISSKGKFLYDSLIIASGAQPFKPPIKGIELSNIISIRSIYDADVAKNLSSKANTCTIIGGGLLGLEIAWAISCLGCKVNIIEHNDRLLPKQTDNTASSLLFEALKKKGINVHLNAQTDEFIGKDVVEGVKLKDGRVIETDFVILSTGVRANTSPFNDVGLDIGKAIKVDEYMKTNIEDVYAAGDAAEFNGNNYCIWPIAVTQGKIAGSNAAGKQLEYEDMKPHTQLKIPGINLFTIGDIFCEDCTSLEELDKDKNRYQKFFLKDNRISGAIVFGDASLALTVKKAVENKIEFSLEPFNINELIKLL